MKDYTRNEIAYLIANLFPPDNSTDTVDKCKRMADNILELLAERIKMTEKDPNPDLEGSDLDDIRNYNQAIQDIINLLYGDKYFKSTFGWEI